MQFKELGKSGVKIPALGMGTWGIGSYGGPGVGDEETAIRALRLGLDLGMKFIDTAESYADGHSEEIIRQAVKSQRGQVFIATKVSREHLSYDEVLKACSNSLTRLGTRYIDLYQIHWPNPIIPIRETMRAMERLVQEGRVRLIGVSNFSVQQTREAQEALSKNTLASNQVKYSLIDRSIETDLLPYAEREHLTIIAYSPIARGRIAQSGRSDQWQLLDRIASKYGKTRTQVALNWLLAKRPVMAIPKAASLEHVKENADATGWRLTKDDEEALSQAFMNL
jgi:aryl-alcohol dehydrogenase-like predicted oxidoreductase